jgi:hypothetical protein
MLNLRLTRDEWDAIEAMAAQAGEPKAELLRRGLKALLAADPALAAAAANAKVPVPVPPAAAPPTATPGRTAGRPGRRKT